MNPAGVSNVAQHAGKYLTATLANEAYGIAVLKIREIIRVQKITPVPQLPACMRGVINLRGRVIPVMDLRLRFGFTAEFSERTCIVVALLGAATDHGTLMGFIVDGVEDVSNLAAADIEPVPEFGAAVDTRCLLGVAKIKGSVTMLLDIDRVVGHDTAASVGAAIPGA